MPSIFDTLTTKEATDVVNAAQSEGMDVTRQYIEGEHWQEGGGWIGPHPADSDHDKITMWDEIARIFTSRNALGEIVKRHAGGVVGKPPMWTLTVARPLEDGEEPSEEEQRMIEEATAALKSWWDRRKVHALLREATAVMLWAGRPVARSPLRLYVPPGRLKPAASAPAPVQGDVPLDEAATGEDTDNTSESAGDVVVVAGTIGEALDLIFPKRAEPEQATVAIDEDTQAEVGIYTYEVPGSGGNRIRVELTYLDEGTVFERRNDTGDVVRYPATVVRTIEPDGTTRRVRLDLGGRLTMFEMARDPLVTPQMEQAQRALNFALTMVPRNVETGGFLERIMLNAQMPGEWETDPSGRRVKFKPSPYITGAGTTQFLQGQEVEQPDGSTTLASPSVQFREPIQITASKDAQALHYEHILDESSQSHVLISGSATPSGKSREEARAEYVQSLEDSAMVVNACGRWIIETPLALAEVFIGKPGFYTSRLRAEFQCRIFRGPLSTGEQEQNRSNVGARLMSRETAMQLNGIDDVDGELARIDIEPGASIDITVKRMQSLQAGTSAGLSLTTAAEIIGFEDDALALIEEDESAPVPEPVDPMAPPADPNADNLPPENMPPALVGDEAA